jgi:cytochrome c oxidase assembly protein subunit 15
MKTAASIAVVLVVTQGILGGVRVLLDRPGLAMLHGCLGPLFFAYTSCLAVVTSRRWAELAHPTETAKDDLPASAKLPGLTILVVGLSYLQLILGAQVRHVPVTATPSDFRLAVIFHIVMAVALSLSVAVLLWKSIRHRPSWYVRGPVFLLAVSMMLQMVLGPATWIVKYGWPMLGESYAISASYLVTSESLFQSVLTTAHVAMGSLILAIGASAAIRCLRLHAVKLNASNFNSVTTLAVATFSLLTHFRLTSGLEVAR